LAGGEAERIILEKLTRRARWEGPFLEVVDFIREVPAVEVDEVAGGVEDFDPVLDFFIFIKEGVATVGHEFSDDRAGEAFVIPGIGDAILVGIGVIGVEIAADFDLIGEAVVI